MKFIGRTNRTFNDYKPSYFFEKRFLTKEQKARNKKIDEEQEKAKKDKESTIKGELKEGIKRQKEKQKREEQDKKDLLKTIAMKNKEINKEVKEKNKSKKKKKKSKSKNKNKKEEVDDPKKDREKLKSVTLSNIVKLRSAADYNVKFK